MLTALNFHNHIRTEFGQLDRSMLNFWIEVFYNSTVNSTVL